MSDPYTILGLEADADEQQVRRRYLQLVRDCPPDREPRRFAEIHAAYEQLRDPAERLRRLLARGPKEQSLDDLIAAAAARLTTERLPTDALVALDDVIPTEEPAR